MQLTTLVTAAGLALSTANAFLLPFPEPSENDIINTLPVPIETDIKVQLPKSAEIQKLELECPGCPLRLGHRKGNGAAHTVNTDVPSHLDLNFEIAHASDHDKLMLNSFELYPNADPFKSALGAPLRPDSPKGKHNVAGHRKHKPQPLYPLGFGLQSQVVSTDEANMELIFVDLQIIEVDSVFVDGVPNVQVKLIKAPEGALMMGGIETTARESQTTPTENQKEQCTSLLCKWKAAISQQLGRVRPNKHCGGRRPGHLKGHPDASHGQPGHPGKMHHGHGPHGHRASWGHLLKNIASHILLPIAVGIAAGVTASVLGMLMGTVIVYLWRTFVRPVTPHRHHHRRGHSTHKAVQKEAAVGDEKQSLMASQETETEAPPAYVEEGLVEEHTKCDSEA